MPFDQKLEFAEQEFVSFIKNICGIPNIGGIVVNGHAGEVTTLTPEERARIIRATRKTAPRSIPVIAGIESMSTAGAVQRTREAVDAGADMLLIFSPFDCRPRRSLSQSEEVPLGFFSEICENTDLPVIVFQYPHWTGLSYTTSTLLKLAEIDNIVGVKNGIASTQLYAEQYFALRDKLSMLVANDSCELLGMMMVGSDGALIGISNIGPQLWAQFTGDCLVGKYVEVRNLFVERLIPIIMNCYEPLDLKRTTVWAMTKETLAQLGVFKSPTMRPPDLGVTENERARIREGLQKIGLLVPQSQTSGR